MSVTYDARPASEIATAIVDDIVHIVQCEGLVSTEIRATLAANLVELARRVEYEGRLPHESGAQRGAMNG
jgi:hypothetical protein